MRRRQSSPECPVVFAHHRKREVAFRELEAVQAYKLGLVEGASSLTEWSMRYVSRSFGVAILSAKSYAKSGQNSLGGFD